MDSGNIKCVVSNKNGSDECSAKLTAVCKLRTNYSIVRSDLTGNGAWLHTSHYVIFNYTNIKQYNIPSCVREQGYIDFICR